MAVALALGVVVAGLCTAGAQAQSSPDTCGAPQWAAYWKARGESVAGALWPCKLLVFMRQWACIVEDGASNSDQTSPLRR